MPSETEGVAVPIEVDDREFNRKFDDIEKRFKKLEHEGKESGKRGSGGNAFLGGFLGGAAGFVAGEVIGSGPVGSMLELITNMLAAALLPLLQAVLPLLEGVASAVGGIVEDANSFVSGGHNGSPGAQPISLDSAVNGAAGLYTGGGVAAGWAVGGPMGAAVGFGAGSTAGATAGFIEYARQQNYGPNYMDKASAIQWSQEREQKTAETYPYQGVWVGPLRIPVKRGDPYGSALEA